ncbi:hypothetical protein [Mycobacterium paraterrae]|uniref:IPT/TIG domain-containing protein n=1 Tax=Mycobacterium paraterrae TaxID=577492 RepID=A0ABY3VIS3_9MYCO|nr:hypothetical protein [Mycobacterium paraterrae]UMB69314.1 hypothetical protein MKK62_23670 [Mycobacterium paraterrae]
MTVPPTASAGPHRVSATCNGDVYASARYTVVEKPSLAIDPDSGPPGSNVELTGTGFVCSDGSDIVDLKLDSGEVLGRGSSGRFIQQVTIPATVPVGAHTIVAACHAHPGVTDEKTFTVTTPVTVTTDSTPVVQTTQTTAPAGTNTPQTPSTKTAPVIVSTQNPSVTTAVKTVDLASYWWVLVLVAAAVVLIGAASHIHDRRRAPPAVHAVSRLRGPPRVTAQEMARAGESTFALRLETRPQQQILTVDEVHHDRSFTE